MSEYIVSETSYFLGTRQEVIGELIRCKECKHWCEGDAYSYCQKLFNCGVLDVYDYMRAEDDFCSWAERRTGE